MYEFIFSKELISQTLLSEANEDMFKFEEHQKKK